MEVERAQAKPSHDSVAFARSYNEGLGLDGGWGCKAPKGSGRVPWRRMPREGEYKACYIGISFYRDVNGQQLWTSSAQMFDERGRGFILKGRRAQTETRGRHPYMAKQDAFDLIRNVLGAYRDHHKHYPARVIVMKTSRFREEEAEGIIEAL